MIPEMRGPETPNYEPVRCRLSSKIEQNLHLEIFSAKSPKFQIFNRHFLKDQ